MAIMLGLIFSSFIFCFSLSSLSLLLDVPAEAGRAMTRSSVAGG